MEVLKLETWINKFSPGEINPDKVQEYLNFIQESVKNYDSERYSEWHHVIPRCVDKEGKYDKQTVQINGADHLRAHMKLVNCFNGLKKRSMGCALYRMRKDNFKDITPEEYEEIRRLFALSQTGELNHAYGKPNACRDRIWITDGVNNLRISSDAEIPEGWYVGSTRDFQGKDMLITDGISSKWWSSSEEIPEGWRRGKTQFIPDHSREKNPIYNKIWINNGTINQLINRNDIVPEGWSRGAIQNNPDQHGENSKIYGRVSITNGIENKLVYPSEELPDGWRYGQTQDHSKYGCAFNKGRIYITDGVRNKMIKQDEIIPEGWRRGMTR